MDPLDRNKNELTHKITALACAYLSGILGCKPIETEVPMSNGMIVDIGTFTFPTDTEIRNCKILKNLFAQEILDKEQKTELFRYRYGDLFTVGVEVKISKEDFKKDLERKYSKEGSSMLPVHLFYLAIPNSLKSEVTASRRYGLIICSDDGERVIKVYPPWFVNRLHSYEIIDFISAIAIRRDHRTNKRAFRDWLKLSRETPQPKSNLNKAKIQFADYMMNFIIQDDAGNECFDIEQMQNSRRTQFLDYHVKQIKEAKNIKLNKQLKEGLI